MAKRKREYIDRKEKKHVEVDMFTNSRLNLFTASNHLLDIKPQNFQMIYWKRLPMMQLLKNLKSKYGASNYQMEYVCYKGHVKKTSGLQSFTNNSPFPPSFRSQKISPAQLDGLSIGLPSEQDTNTPLAHLVIERAGRGDSSKSYQQKYLLQNRKTNIKQEQTIQQDSKTQLIAMAGGNTGLQTESMQMKDNLGNEEMESLHVMLPNRDVNGRYSLAPVKIRQFMQLVIETPVESNDMTGSSDTDPRKVANELKTNDQTTAISAGTKRQRAQPWSRLKGFFSPAGSKTAEEEDENRVETKSKKAKMDKDTGEDIASFPKQRKKSKKSSS